MSEHTKTRPTDKLVEIRLVGPATKKKSMLEAVKVIGFRDVNDSIPWRDAFPDLTNQRLPGAYLKGIRKREELSQAKLSEQTGIPQRHLSEMENGKRPIGKKNAVILANALNADYRNLL
jgi:DNA-binding XRE family transcriptional regulator